MNCRNCGDNLPANEINASGLCDDCHAEALEREYNSYTIQDPNH